MGSYVFRVADTVWPDIWYMPFLTVLYAGGVVSFHEYYKTVPDQDTAFITIFGLVIGLLLVFRTNTGYERYGEGRKAWADMGLHIRNLTRIFLMTVKAPTEEDVLATKSAINLLLAFAIATKNHLRGEFGRDKDPLLKAMIGHLPKIWEPLEVEGHKGKDNLGFVTVENNAGGNTDRKLSIKSEKAQKTYKAHDLLPPTNIPLEIIYYLQTYYMKKSVAGHFSDVNTQRVSIEGLNGLTITLSVLERIKRTPIPLAYSVHLHQTIWLYIATLPWLLVGKMDWVTVPVVGLTTFAFLGMVAIGKQIEDPFGYDDNDLPLDDYCQVIGDEVRRIIKKPFPSAEEWIGYEQAKSS